MLRRDCEHGSNNSLPPFLTVSMCGGVCRGDSRGGWGDNESGLAKEEERRREVAERAEEGMASAKAESLGKAEAEDKPLRKPEPKLEAEVAMEEEFIRER